MKIIIISPKNRTVYNFRGDLIKELISAGYSVMVTGPDDTDKDKITALGTTFVKVPLRKNGLNPFEDIRYYFRLKQLIKKEKPDITFGYTIKPNIYGAVAAKAGGAKHRVSLVTGAGYLFSANTLKARVLRMVAKVLYRAGFAAADTVVFQNPDDRDEFISHGLVKADKTRVVNGSGVNMQKFIPAPLPQTPIFFMLARIMKSKGVFEYLEAAEKVKAKHPEATFMLLGAFEGIPDSIKKEDIQHYIDAGVIDYYGETDDVREFYKKCSVFVLPSYREGTPRTVLEAMAMKRAIITTDVPGCRGTVLDGQTGFLVPKGDVETLAEKMIWLIEQPNRIKEMGESAYQLCQEKYDVNKVNQDMMNILINQ
ncbi:MAG: glycosyltransferase family 4 protein [Eubacteriales bacterium]